jgi:hypothetical protein
MAQNLNQSSSEIPQAEQEKQHELSYYTLSHPSPAFIHQHIVDAFAAQHATVNSTPIYLAFALIGLYLHLEKGYSGREVQHAHMLLANKRKQWPRFPFPEARGEITVFDVVAKPPGPERDQAIESWCASAWEAWRDCHEQVRQLVELELK